MKVGGASARFATAPFFWNWLMWLTARVVPRTLLTNPNFAMSFAKAIGPLVAPIDKIVGEAVAMKVRPRSCRGTAWRGGGAPSRNAEAWGDGRHNRGQGGHHEGVGLGVYTMKVWGSGCTP
eukprot:190281-Chlamydomonas_euryale.AAC.1